jgi:peptidyl-prolyl cis-trans isomerase D
LPDLDPSEPLAPKAFELKQPDELYTRPIPTSSGAIVMQLKEKTEASRDEFAKEKANVVEQLLQPKAAEALARYVQDLKRGAGERLKIMSEFGEESKARADDEE